MHDMQREGASDDELQERCQEATKEQTELTNDRARRRKTEEEEFRYCHSATRKKGNATPTTLARSLAHSTRGMPPSECAEDDPRLGARRNEGDDDDGGRSGDGERNITQGCVGEIHQQPRGGGKHNTAQHSTAHSPAPIPVERNHLLGIINSLG